MLAVGRWARWVAVGMALGTAAEARTACTTDADCGADQVCVRPVGSCQGAGVCDDRLAFCPQVFAPACGCDGLSYVSDCAARHGGGGAAHRGACCVGACTALDRVGVGDLIIGVGQSLGEVGVHPCHSFDRDQSERVTIDELITAVGNALRGCH